MKKALREKQTLRARWL